METITPAPVQDENYDIRNKGGFVARKANAPKGHNKKNGPTIRKALADLSKSGRSSTTTPLSSKVKFPKAKSVNTGAKKNTTSAFLQNIQIPEEFTEEEIERVHFSGTDMDILEEKMKEEDIENEVQRVMSWIKPNIPWPDMPLTLYGSKPTKVDFESTDHLEYEPIFELPEINHSRDYLDEEPVILDYPSPTPFLDDLFELSLKESDDEL